MRSIPPHFFAPYDKIEFLVVATFAKIDKKLIKTDSSNPQII